MYTFSVGSPFKNALFMSTCLNIYPLLTAKVRTILIVAVLTTGLKVSLKSVPGVCKNYFTTSLALYLFMVSSGLYFTLYTHLFPITL